MELLPRPTSYREGGPGAELSDGMVISADSASSGVADLLASELEAATGWQVNTAGPGADSAHGRGQARGACDDMALAGNGAAEGLAFPDPSADKYRLTVSERGVEIVAPTAAGVFYGTRTLRQLLPADLFRSAPSTRPYSGRRSREWKSPTHRALGGAASAWTCRGISFPRTSY